MNGLYILHIKPKRMDFKILETFDNYIDANLTLGRMEEAGVNSWLKDEILQQ